jgi:hypothetical protein
VRTGYLTDGTNCFAWTSSGADFSGLAVRLSCGYPDIGVWQTESLSAVAMRASGA